MLDLTHRRLQASQCLSLPPPVPCSVAAWPWMSHQPVSHVPPGRAPAGTKHPIYLPAGSVARAASSFPCHQERAPPCLPRLSSLPCHALAHPFLLVQPSQGGWRVLGQCQELGSSPSPSSEGCAPRRLQQLPPGSISSLGVLDGCGSQCRALCRS